MNNGCLDCLTVDDIYMILVWGYGEKPAINICLEFWHEKNSLAPRNNALGRLNALGSFLTLICLHVSWCLCMGVRGQLTGVIVLPSLDPTATGVRHLPCCPQEDFKHPTLWRVYFFLILLWYIKVFLGHCQFC